MCHCHHLDHPALVTGRSCVAWKFWHGISCIRILVFPHPHMRQDLTLDHILRIGNCPLLYSQAPAEFYRFSSEGSGHCQFIIAHGRCGRLKTGAYFNGRVHTYADGYGQFLPQFFRPLRHGSDMAGTRCKEYGEFIPALDTEPVDRHITETGVRMCSVTHSHCYVRSPVIRRIGRRGNQFI